MGGDHLKLKDVVIIADLEMLFSPALCLMPLLERQDFSGYVGGDGVWVGKP